MKNLIYLLILIVMLVPSLAVGQGLIIKSALTSSTFMGDDVEDFSRAISWQAGLYLPVEITEKIQLTPGLSYSLRGSFSEESFNETIMQTRMSYTSRFDMDLEYIDLVVPAKFTMHDRIYSLIGLYQSFLISQKSEYTSQECINGNCTGFTEVIDEDFFKDADMGFIVGLGLRVFNGLAVEGTLQHGFKDVIKEDGSATNQSLNIGLALHF